MIQTKQSDNVIRDKVYRSKQHGYRWRDVVDLASEGLSYELTGILKVVEPGWL